MKTRDIIQACNTIHVYGNKSQQLLLPLTAVILKLVACDMFLSLLGT